MAIIRLIVFNTVIALALKTKYLYFMVKQGCCTTVYIKHIGVLAPYLLVCITALSYHKRRSSSIKEMKGIT
jgi:hypothetical protein